MNLSCKGGIKKGIHRNQTGINLKPEKYQITSGKRAAADVTCARDAWYLTAVRRVLAVRKCVLGWWCVCEWRILGNFLFFGGEGCLARFQIIMLDESAKYFFLTLIHYNVRWVSESSLLLCAPDKPEEDSVLYSRSQNLYFLLLSLSIIRLVFLKELHLVDFLLGSAWPLLKPLPNPDHSEDISVTQNSFPVTWYLFWIRSELFYIIIWSMAIYET